MPLTLLLGPKFAFHCDFQIGKAFEEFGIEIHFKEPELCPLLSLIFGIENRRRIDKALQSHLNLPTARVEMEKEVPVARKNKQDFLHRLVESDGSRADDCHALKCPVHALSGNVNRNDRKEKG